MDMEAIGALRKVILTEVTEIMLAEHDHNADIFEAEEAAGHTDSRKQLEAMAAMATVNRLVQCMALKLTGEPERDAAH